MPTTDIEVKHIYQNSSFFRESGVYLPFVWTNHPNLTFESPNGVLQPVAQVKAWTLPVPEQGTDENQRIGNKITPQSYHCDIFIGPSLVNDYLPNLFNKFFLSGGGIQSETNYLLTKSKYMLRFMVVDFFSDARFKIPDNFVSNIEGSADNDDYNTVMKNLRDWYRTTFVPTGSTAANPTQEINVSCSQKMLRESTQYTGSFKILHDRLIKLSLKNHFTDRISLDLDLKKYKDFNINANRYTKHNILFIIFNCMAPAIDMDQCMHKVFNAAYLEDNTNGKTGYRNTFNFSIGFTGKLRYLDL